MSYLIEYFRRGETKGSTSWSGSLEETRKVAADGLHRRRADAATIVDTLTRKEVATLRRDAKRG